jgi:DNA ligase-1
MSILDTVYKRDSAGKVRVWSVEIDEAGGRYRTIAGLQDGAKVTAEWTVCAPKSKPTAAEQAVFEANSERDKKLAREYRVSLAEIDAKQNSGMKPMLAHKFEAFDKPCYSQPKLDGIRCIATAAGLWSREGKPFLSCPHIVEALAPLFAFNPDLVLDGELYNHDLKEDFNAIVSMVKRQKCTPEDFELAAKLVQYHVYDMPSSSKSFEERSNNLFHLFSRLNGEPGPTRLVNTLYCETSKELDDTYTIFLNEGYEGQMVRRVGSIYEQKRSKALLKRKEFQDDEYPVVRIEEGQGNWTGCAKRITCLLPDGREFGSGVRGTQAQMTTLLNGPKPEKATIRFFQLTPDGIPRFGVATAFHTGDRV